MTYVLAGAEKAGTFGVRPALLRMSLMLGILSLIQPALATAANVQLAWDRVKDQRVGAYEVHYGNASRRYQQKMSASATTTTVRNLTPGKIYYFAVRACTTNRSQCSAFSNEVSKRIPSATTQAQAPQANFSARPRSGSAPLTVVLNDTSTGRITKRVWHLGDGKTATGRQVVHSYRTPGTYTVRLVVSGPGGTDREVKKGYVQVKARSFEAADNALRSSDASGATESPPFALEVGELAVTPDWQWVNFERRFEDPIVIVGPLSDNGPDPVTVRVDGVDTKGFWVRAQEWDYLDSDHAAERASYIVVERGRHRLAPGVWLEAGRIDSASTAGYSRTNFGSTFRTAPVVMTTVTSAGDSAAVSTQIDNAGQAGFRLRLRLQEADNGAHSLESVDYIAVQPGAGLVDGRRFEARRIDGRVNHKPFRLGFQPSFAAPPFFVAGMQTASGGDPASLRWDSLEANGVDIFVQEEQSSDKELRHTQESVGYFAIERR